MCGIFGILTRDKSLPSGILENAVRSLSHRGPDDSGTITVDLQSGGQLGLAHTRLSILDLSPLGHQPMHDPATGNWVVFNGEIYNFRELRVELESWGAQFKSHSDTEVILAGYRLWGSDLLDRLRGMFAFALWDASRQTLLLARDPLGIKPLYYYHSQNRFLFASEVRTLLGTGLIPRQLDRDGVFSFLAFGSVYEPRTIIDGVLAVPPGHCISIANDIVTARGYWNPLKNASSSQTHSNGNNPAETNNADADLTFRLRHAIRSHLVSDVPVGVFLSGGIDSSAIVALMHAAGVRPATFSLVFREADFNEAEYSRIVARRFSSDHHELMISQSEALSALPAALRAMDQPTIDGINTWLVSSKVRATGVKVALTGLGADEVFAGYSNFRRVPRLESIAARFAKMPSALRRPVAASVGRFAAKGDRARKVAHLAAAFSADAGAASHPYFLLRNLFTASERDTLYASDAPAAEHDLAAELKSSLDAAHNLDPVNRVSYLESHFYMRNTLLRDSDFMSMAHGLELRVPFLDRDLVAACFQIPGKDKLRNGTPKPLLLDNLGIQLPNEIVHRPKRGFTLPFEHWLRGEMKPMVEKALSGGVALPSKTSYGRDANSANDDHPLLNPNSVRDVWTRFLNGQTSWSRPWSLFVLSRWCEQNL